MGTLAALTCQVEVGHRMPETEWERSFLIYVHISDHPADHIYSRKQKLNSFLYSCVSLSHHAPADCMMS